MTPDERDLILSLATCPGTAREDTRQDILRHFGTDDGVTLGLELLRDAFKRQDAEDTELALIVCGTFGFTSNHLELLLSLASAEWHQKHEDVISMLGELRTSRAIDALYEATQSIPEYLDYDESRALAVKAIWALGRIPGPESERVLRGLLSSDSDILQGEAEKQLQRRGIL